MLYKAVGALILIAASLIYGRQKVLEERRKLRLTEALCDLVKQIGDNIDHRLRPLPEIFRTYRNEALEECGFLKSVRETGLREAWESRSAYFRMLDGKVSEQFSAFCLEIGRGYREEEVKLCTFTAKQLQEECAKLRNDAKNKEKLYRTIPPLMAMSAVLVLL
ncbi:MAG: hypothetical protein IJY35_11890 [Clostridia bacterium]|nr:hypothetical protein [Clostridia bacterium]